MPGNLKFYNIYEQYKERVWRHVSRYVSRHHDREDLFQEVFVRIYQALPSFRGEAKLETWLFRVTANTAFNYLKKQKRFAKAREILGNLRLIDSEPINEVDSPGYLLQPLEKLNERQRAILILVEVEEFKLAEVAEMLTVPLGTVKSNLNRAKEILKKELAINEGI